MRGSRYMCLATGWDLLPCKCEENLILMNNLDSEGCLKKLCQTKLSLNVMPWFKDGAHDRIFNTMLNGAVCLTDSSIYLDSILHDDVDCSIYSLSQMDKLPEIAAGLLANPVHMQEIADQGYAMAKEAHTWAHRAKVLHDLIEG